MARSNLILFIVLLSVSAQAATVTNGLIAWFKFDDDFSTNTHLLDSSGNGNHAQRFGKTGDPLAPLYTNFPARVLVSSTPNVTEHPNYYAGEFTFWNGTGWGIYGKEGKYAGITNITQFTNLSTMSIGLWARYYTADGGDYHADHNAILIGGGSANAIPGTWEFGRLDSPNVKFSILTNTTEYFYCGFPDINQQESGDGGNTTNWNHYFMTWDSGELKIYWNGELHQTKTTEHITHLSLSPNSQWISLGVNTHGGTPMLEDEIGEDYPNHGWMNGVMDDVRFYNRTLSAGEVLQIFNGDEQLDFPVEISGDVTISGDVMIK